MKKFALGILVSIGFVLSVNTAIAAQPTSLEGTISIEYEDFESHSQLRYWLTDGENSRKELALQKAPGWMKSGQKVRVSGSPQGKKFVTDEHSLSLLETSDTSVSVTGTQTVVEDSVVTGQRKILAVEIHSPYYDVDVVTQDEFSDMLSNEVNSYFQEVSYGKVSFTGTVSEPLVVNYNTDTCDTWDLSDKADEKLRERGLEPNEYDHIIYYIPYYAACGWNGSANIGGPRSWIRSFRLSTIKHELGHNLGLYHANKKECGTQTTNSESCSIISYGDTFSGMSNSSIPLHFNGFHKEQLGWLEGKIETLIADGTVTISPIEEQTSNPNLIKVLKNVDENGNKHWYYIEYRQAIGYDTDLALEHSSDLFGIRIREGIESIPNSSVLLDPTPQSSTDDWSDITLLPGYKYVDREYGITVSNLDSGAYGVEVDVEYMNSSDDNTCVSTPPILDLLSSDQNAQPGEELVFGYEVTNKDSLSCSASIIDITMLAPEGWGVRTSDHQLSLAPGDSYVFYIYPTVALDASDGVYTISAQVSRDSDINNTAHASNSVQVVRLTDNNLSPVAVNDLEVLTTVTTINIDVLANDYDPENDQIEIVGLSQSKKGSVFLNSDNTIRYVPSKSFKDLDEFTYRISDGVLTSSATVSIRLETNFDKGNGKGPNK